MAHTLLIRRSAPEAPAAPPPAAPATTATAAVAPPLPVPVPVPPFELPAPAAAMFCAVNGVTSHDGRKVSEEREERESKKVDIPFKDTETTRRSGGYSEQQTQSEPNRRAEWGMKLVKTTNSKKSEIN